jgi:hypothetical protein
LLLYVFFKKEIPAFSRGDKAHIAIFCRHSTGSAYRPIVYAQRLRKGGSRLLESTEAP